MSLINCPDCKSLVSNSAVNCPNCGYPISNLMKDSRNQKIVQNTNESDSIQTKPKNGCTAVLGALFGLLLILFLINKCSNNDIEPAKVEAVEIETISKEDSIKNVAINDSIIKENKLEEEIFFKTKAGKIYKKHQSWSKSDCEKLANSEIWIGMEYEMVVYLRGKPNNINTSNYGNGKEYQACWSDFDPGCFYFSENQIITSYN